MKQHPDAEILRAIADGHKIQRNNAGTGWTDESLEVILHDIANGVALRAGRYRIKPRTIKVGRHTVPAPLRVEPACGGTVYLVNLHEEDGVTELEWSASPMTMRRYLYRGMLHLSRKAAQEHFNALVNVSTS